MKKRFSLSIAAVFTLLLLVTSFCELPDTRPECEKNNTGEVFVKNNSSYMIVVDVTWGFSDYNDERRLGPGSATTYENVPAGSVTVWGRVFDEDYWSSDAAYVTSCETYNFTWTKK